MKKFLVIVMLLALVTTGIFANGQKEAEAKTGFKIGYCSNNFNDTFQTYINAAAEAYVKENSDLSITLVDAQEDVIRQQDLVNTLIAQGVDALIVVPVDTSAMSAIT